MNLQIAASKIVKIFNLLDDTERSKTLRLIFEADPKLAKVISQAIANFEGTQAAKPPSNATQVEYIDDYLDRLRGEETDFYK